MAHAGHATHRHRYDSSGDIPGGDTMRVDTDLATLVVMDMGYPRHKYVRSYQTMYFAPPTVILVRALRSEMER